jgi:general stress protein YciG
LPEETERGVEAETPGTAGTPEGSSRRGEHLPAQASEGGRAVVAKYGREHMAEIGRKGSRAVRRKYGLRFYSEIAAQNKGVKKQKRQAA